MLAVALVEEVYKLPPAPFLWKAQREQCIWAVGECFQPLSSLFVFVEVLLHWSGQFTHYRPGWKAPYYVEKGLFVDYWSLSASADEGKRANTIKACF